MIARQRYTFSEVPHSPDCKEGVYRLQQKNDGSGMLYRVECETCGGYSEPFPESELFDHWPEAAGVSGLRSTSINVRYHSDEVLDNFIEKSGAMLRDSSLFGGRALTK